MRRHVFIRLIVVLVCAAGLYVVTQLDYSGALKTNTSVLVEEGSVEVKSLKEPSETEVLSAGEKIIASDGVLGVKQTPTVSKPETVVALTTQDRVSSATEVQLEPSEEEVQDATKEGFWITGFARAEQGGVIIGAKVSATKIEPERGSSVSTHTNDEGYYALSLSGPGKYWVRSVPPERYLEAGSLVTLSMTEREVREDFVHPAAELVLRGKVIDKETSQAVPNAKVTLIPVSGESLTDQHAVSGRTGEDGRFTIRGIAEGHFMVVAEAKGYVPYGPRAKDPVPRALARLRIDKKTQNNEITLKLEPGRAATISVHDTDNQPVPEASVRIHMVGQSRLLRRVWKTDAQGKCTIDILPKGLAVVRANKKPYGEGLSEVFEPKPVENPTLVEVTLAQAASVSGRVTDEKGNPAKDCRLSAMHKTVAARLGGWVPMTVESAGVDEDGQYSFEGLGEGTYEIRVRKDREESAWRRTLASREVTLKAGEKLVGVDFVIEEMEGNEEVRGKIISESGESIQNARVFISVMSSARDPEETLSHKGGSTDEQGEFHITGLPKEEMFRLSVQAKGYKQHNQRYDMNGDFLTITLETSGLIQGVVIAEESQKPVGGAKVTLRKARTNIIYQPLFAISTDGGTFRFDDVQPDLYQITAEAEGFAKWERQLLTVKSGEVIDDIMIEMKSGVEFSGILVDENNNPVGGASIGLHSGVFNPNRHSIGFQRPTVLPSTVTSAADGSFRIKDISPEGDTLVISHENFAPRTFTATPDMIGKEPAIIVLSSGGAIEGIVADRDEKPLREGFLISAFNYPENLYCYQTVTDENGKYRFEHLPAMPFIVMKRGTMRGGTDREYKRVTVKEGEVVRADFGFGEGAVIQGTVYKDGSPVPGAQIALVQQEGPSRDFRLLTRSGDDGSYVFRGVPEGEFAILFTTKTDENTGYLNRFTAEGIREISVSQEQKKYLLDLHARSYEIVGRVRDIETGEPISDARMRPLLSVESKNYAERYLQTASTDAEGIFRLRAREPGTYRLIASKEGYTNEEFSVTVRSAEPADLVPPPVSVEVLLSKVETSVKVQLLFEDKPLLSNVEEFVGVKDGFIQEVMFKPVLDQPGLYVVTGLPEGTIDLVVSCRDSGRSLMSYPQPVSLEKGQTGLIFLNLYEMMNYRITLATSDGGKIQGSVHVELPDFPNASRLPGSLFLSGNELAFPIPAGRHLVRLKAPGYRMVQFVPADLAEPGDAPGRAYVTLRLEEE